VTNGVMCFRWKEAEKLMWLKNRFRYNTSIGIRICIIKLLQQLFYLRRSAINSVDTFVITAFKEPLSCVHPAR
jgi:hypothetical protein